MLGVNIISRGRYARNVVGGGDGVFMVVTAATETVENRQPSISAIVLSEAPFGECRRSRQSQRRAIPARISKRLVHHGSFQLVAIFAAAECRRLAPAGGRRKQCRGDIFASRFFVGSPAVRLPIQRVEQNFRTWPFPPARSRHRPGISQVAAPRCSASMAPKKRTKAAAPNPRPSAKLELPGGHHFDEDYLSWRRRSPDHPRPRERSDA